MLCFRLIIAAFSLKKYVEKRRGVPPFETKFLIYEVKSIIDSREALFGFRFSEDDAIQRCPFCFADSTYFVLIEFS